MRSFSLNLKSLYPGSLAKKTVGFCTLPHPLLTLVLLFLWISNFTSNQAQAKPRSIYVLEVFPHHSEEYSINQEIRQIEQAIDLALKHHFKIRKCKIPLFKHLKKGNEEVLANSILEIKNQDPHAIILGLSRSNSARLAAKLSLGSTLTGISVGSVAGYLNHINPRFFSIASSIDTQWTFITQEMRNLKCTKKNTMGIFNPRSYFSQQFRGLYLRDQLGEIQDLNSLISSRSHRFNLEGKNCIFFGTYLADAEAIAMNILQSNWSGHLIGNTDWSYYPRELSTFLLSQKEHLLRVAIPSGWQKNSNPASIHFAHQFRSLASMEPTPAAAYSYDATIFAAELACGYLDLNLEISPQSINLLPLLRTYEGMSHSGHFLAPVRFLRR